jgi:hypothetical protein
MDKTALREFIAEHYNLDEFRTLCFDLGAEWIVSSPVGRERRLLVRMVCS